MIATAITAIISSTMLAVIATSYTKRLLIANAIDETTSEAVFESIIAINTDSYTPLPVIYRTKNIEKMWL
jgi:hypothetical protein